MKITPWPETELLALVEKSDLGQQVNFLLRALRLQNERERPCTLVSVHLSVYAGTQLLREWVYRDQALLGLCRKTCLNRLGLQGFNAQMLLGRTEFWDLDALVEGPELLPGQEAGFLLEQVQLIHSKQPDRLHILVEYSEQGEGFSATYAAETEVEIKFWTSSNRYLFPLQGSWLLANTPFSPSHHRLGYAQEFALDLIQLDAKGRFASPERLENHLYPGYGADVLAVAEGRVVACI